MKTPVYGSVIACLLFALIAGCGKSKTDANTPSSETGSQPVAVDDTGKAPMAPVQPSSATTATERSAGVADQPAADEDMDGEDMDGEDMDDEDDTEDMDDEDMDDEDMDNEDDTE